MNSHPTLNLTVKFEISRCAICGTPLVRAMETTEICVHCAPGARADIEIINAHFRTPAGALARLNPALVEEPC